MSKNIIIQKAGIPQSLTVDALRLKTQGGGTEDWVPADGKNLVELQIGGSGTYKASDYNAYGIAVVRVTPKYGGGATSKAVERDFTEKHTPSIKEGGKSRNFSVVMLKTNLQGGGTCLWVPRMDVELKSKYITQSGTYSAKADDCYGFDQVTVSGVDVEITQDDDGDDVAEITDGGTTTEQKLPSSIVVDVPPTKTVYSDGQTIDYTGMVVKAYTRSGQLWTDASHPNGIIPISELTLPVTIAHADQGGATSDLDTGDFIQPIPLSGSLMYVMSSYEYIRNTYRYTPTNGGIIVIMKNNIYQTEILYASQNHSEAVLKEYVYTNDETGKQRRTYSTLTPESSYTFDGKTVYYSRLTAGHTQPGQYAEADPIVENYGSRDDNYVRAAAWTAIYGEISGGGSSIPVQWNRPYDSELLETGFSITVA